MNMTKMSIMVVGNKTTIIAARMLSELVTGSSVVAVIGVTVLVVIIGATVLVIVIGAAGSGNELEEAPM